VIMRTEPQPLVTVLVNLYNGGRYIDETLESVFAQSYSAFKVVVIDDGSTDGAADGIERRYPPERLTIVRRAHGGLNEVRAASLDHADTDYVAFLDQDDVWLREKLDRQMAAAEASPQAALIFSDAYLIDEAGGATGRLSAQHPFDPPRLAGAGAHLELLRRGCFVSFSTALARRQALKEVGGFDRAYRYAADYDLWLRLTRRYSLVFVDEPLAKYRVHATQFTQRFPEIALREQVAILDPMRQSASYPRAVRNAVGDNLLGQHWLALQTFMRQRRLVFAARAAVGMLRYPDRIRDWVHDRLNQTRVGPVVETGIQWTLWVRNLTERAGLLVVNWTRAALAMPRRVPRALLRRIRNRRTGREASPASLPGTISPPTEHVWIDGSALAAPQVGHFNMTCELIRALAEREYIVHVTTSDAGRAAMDRRLKGQRSRVMFERDGARRPLPRGRAPVPHAMEVVVWQGRFRWTDTRRLAIVPDLTTYIHPELHTRENIAWFDGFLRYAQRHAHGIVTVSEASRRDIVSRVPVCPDSVGILPMPVNPQYVEPVFDAGVVSSMGVPTPYLLCVGTIEPRKNLRRLVTAFQRLQNDTPHHTLVLAGPPGWDATFGAFLGEANASGVHLAGYVPLETLPSLYHFASAVVYPSVYEGFGLPVLEAMCCSAVVLASDSSAIPEVLGPGALQFDPYDVEDMANAMRRALTMTAEESRRYRTRNRTRALAHLDRLRTEPPLPGLWSGGIGAA